MFTRNVLIKLKANSAPEFTRLMEQEIIPLLRTQPGFRDEITFVAPERSEVMAMSFWATAENAETYNRTAYPQVLKILVKVIEGIPMVSTFVIATSTFHQITAKAA
jgi:hypothetical protein